MGCTAVSAFVKGRKIFIANCGDSRAVICRSGLAMPLTVDHKPSLPLEKARILAAGGVVLHGRVNGNLNLTRSIGDFAFKAAGIAPEAQVITAYPVVV
jgi:serine/threonine protein phosphatase PrpC